MAIVPVSNAGMLARGIKTCVQLPLGPNGITVTEAYVNIPGNANFIPTTSWSLAIWWNGICAASTASIIGNGIIFSYQHVATNAGSIVFKNEGGAQIGNYRVNTTQSTPTTGNFNNTITNVIMKNGWYRTVLTWNGTTVQLYTQGQADGSVGLTGTMTYLAADPIQLGLATTGFSNTNSGFPGLIADAKWYPGIVLSALDAALDFGCGRTTQEAGLKGWWKLNDGRGTTARDYKGNSNGTLLNGARFYKLPQRNKRVASII